MSIQSSVNSIMSSAASVGSKIKRDSPTDIRQQNINQNLEYDTQISQLAMSRVEKQRDSMIAQRQILGGNASGSQNT